MQEEIQRRSRTGIVNKGSYHAPGAPPDEKEKPLFLRVVPGSDLPVGCQFGTTACQTCNLQLHYVCAGVCRTQPHPGPCALHWPTSATIAAAALQTEAAKRAAVEWAVADIHALIRGERLQPRQPAVFNAAAPPSYNAAPPPGHLASAPPPAAPWTAPPASGPLATSPHMVSLFMGFDAPPAFNLVSRLQGPGQRMQFENGASSLCDTRRLSNNAMCTSASPTLCHSSCQPLRVVWRMYLRCQSTLAAGSAYFDHISKETSSTLQLRGQGTGQAERCALFTQSTRGSACVC